MIKPLKTKTIQYIELQDWDEFVKEIYNRPYSFQQQEGCKARGTFNLTIPSPWADDYENDTIPEIINGDEMGVSLKAWLARDPEQHLNDTESDHWCIDLFYARNFYPDIYTLANDMHEKGHLPAGEYVINIDW